MRIALLIQIMLLAVITLYANPPQGENNNTFKLSPNPVQTELAISLPEAGSGNIVIHNVQGVLMFKDNFHNLSFLKIDFQHFPSGLYFIQIQMPGNMVSKKVLKIN
ncbi:MAG: T9SS type A sorting domain-containing protein [Candidatus Cyclobacteriaceae bacterium M3_2C_046]